MCAFSHYTLSVSLVPVTSEHEESPEPGEFLDARQFEVREGDEAEGGPEEGLWRLEEIGEPPPHDASVALLHQVGESAR